MKAYLCLFTGSLPQVIEQLRDEEDLNLVLEHSVVSP